MLASKSNMPNRHHSSHFKKMPIHLAIAIFAACTCYASSAIAGFDAMNFKPVTDQGFYLTVEQSKTLGTMGHAIGFTGDYSVNSLVIRDAAGAKVQDVIQKQVGLNLGGALGLTPWLDVGVGVAGVAYQQFLTPVTLVQDNGARFGDITANLKVQLINSEKSLFGLSLMPFMTFPTGDDGHFTGENGFAGGGKVILDTKRINDHVSFSVNAGGLARKDYLFSPTSKLIDDQFLYGAAVNVAVAKPVQLIAEANGSTSIKNFFGSASRSLELDGAVRFIPDVKQNWQITAGGGAGILNGPGTPNYRVFTSLALRFPHKVEPHIVQEPIREKVISTNEIHFAFNKSVIKPDSYHILDQMLSDIQGDSEVTSVRVEGHTDSIGSDEYNQKLSQARADSVRMYLINKGYPSEKINSVGMSEGTPVSDNSTKQGRSLNRRVELHLQLQNNTNTKVKKSAEVSPTYEDGDRN